MHVLEYGKIGMYVSWFCVFGLSVFHIITSCGMLGVRVIAPVLGTCPRRELHRPQDFVFRKEIEPLARSPDVPFFFLFDCQALLPATPPYYTYHLSISVRPSGFVFFLVFFGQSHYASFISSNYIVL